MEWFQFNNANDKGVENKEVVNIRVDKIIAISELGNGDFGIWYGDGEGSYFYCEYADGCRLKEVLGIG